MTIRKAEHSTPICTGSPYFRSSYSQSLRVCRRRSIETRLWKTCSLSHSLAIDGVSNAGTERLASNARQPSPLAVIINTKLGQTLIRRFYGKAVCSARIAVSMSASATVIRRVRPCPCQWSVVWLGRGLEGRRRPARQTQLFRDFAVHEQASGDLGSFPGSDMCDV